MKNRLPLPTTIVAAASPGACGMYTRCSLSVTPVARYTGVLEHPVYVYTRVCIIYDRNIAGCSFAHEHAVSVYLARYFPRKKKGKKERKVTSLLLSPLHPFFSHFFPFSVANTSQFQLDFARKKRRSSGSCPRLSILQRCGIFFFLN